MENTTSSISNTLEDEISKRLVISKMLLKNFKSYAGEIEIGPFHKCFSAVVGPNGSGKSNVIDALLFVFGKRATKLRLKKVSELVHRSASYPNLDMATVSVYFHEIYEDSKDENINTFEENYRIVPNSSFCVSRSATKSNVSKYYINNQLSNFTEVTSMLRAKGIDLDNNRFLILQGEVEQIAMMKSKGTTITNANGETVSSGEDGLLEYLEDIIGSNVYVEPTERVWKEVEECNEVRLEKMNRVKLAEKEKGHLEGPRAEALEYLRKEKEVYFKTNILYQLYIQDASKNRQLCETKHQELQVEYEKEKKKMDANRHELQEMETKYKGVKQSYDENVHALEEAKAEYAELEKRDVKNREDLKYAKAQLKELKDSNAKEEKKKQNMIEKQEENERLTPLLEQEIEKLQIKAKKQDEKLEEILLEHKDETAKLGQEMEKVQQELEPHQSELNTLRSVIQTTDTEIQLLEEPAKQAKISLQNLASSIDETDKLIKDLRDDQMQQSTKFEEMQQRIGVAQDELIASEREEDHISKLYQEARRKEEEANVSATSHANQNRLVKALLDARRPGQPLADAGLLGRLGDLGAIDKKYDVAISTACPALDNLVVKTTSGAQACVDFLRKNNLGRSTFIILEQLSYLQSKCKAAFRQVNAPSGELCPRLFDLVKIPDMQFAPAFYFALKDTLVAKDLDEASAIAYQGTQCRFRVVTLDGQLVELSGAMSGGGNRARKGGMSSSVASTSISAAEMAAIREEVTIQKHHLDNARTRRTELYNEVTALKGGIELFEKEAPKLTLNLTAAETKLKDMRARKKTLQETSELSKADKKKHSSLQKEKEAREADLNKVQEKVTKMSNRLSKLKERILDVGGSKLRKEQDVAAKITKKIEEKTKELTKLRVDFKSGQKFLVKCSQALEKYEADIQSAQDSIEKIRKVCAEVEETAVSVLQKREEIEAETQTKSANLKKVEKEYNKLMKQWEKMRSSEVDLQNNLEDCAKMLEENKKKEEYWNGKLVTLHNTYTKELEHNTQAYEVESSLSTEENKNKPSKKNSKAEAEISNASDDEMKSADEVTLENDKLSDEEKENDENMEDDANSDSKDAAKLPTLDKRALSNYNSEELKYEISVLEQQRDELKSKVNMGALVEYNEKVEECKARVLELEQSTEVRDLKRREYEELRRKRLDEFMTGFRIITLKLKEMYQMITLGGDAELELVDSSDPFSEGVVFSVRPSKKSWKNISNLSGGEKTLASLALVFALHHYKPTPLYVMDEIDAALDFKNVSIVGNYIKERTRNAQFVIISLRNNMFELADRLVGIYKTNDATKSVSINPRKYESITTTAASSSLNAKDVTPAKKTNGASSSTGKYGAMDLERRRKKTRTSDASVASTNDRIENNPTPLQDRTNTK